MINEAGLTEKQAIESRKKYGENKITIKKQNGFMGIFIESLGEPMTKILLIALAIKTLLLFKNFDWYETVGIAIAIFIASLISTLSEYGSEAAFKKLQEETSNIMTRVFRDGHLKEVAMSEIVKNDIVLLQSGDKIPADGIVINGRIEVDESALNGESKEVTKDNQKNQLLKGSIVCSGECKMLVTAVGDKTIYGSIGLELQEDNRESPLKYRLRMLAKTISYMGYVGAILVAISYLLYVIIYKGNFHLISSFDNFYELVGYILHAITLAVTVIVVAVPEGLPMMITVVLSRNMKRMLKDKILVRKLLGIETAGSLNILFTDKTGTLTKGKLEVVKYIAGDLNDYTSRILDFPNMLDLLTLSLYYNNDSVYDEDNKIAIGSNATDRALLEYIYSYKTKFDVKKGDKLPFNSQYKISMTEVSGKYKLTLIKGVPEKIIEQSDSYYDKDGKRRPLLNKKELLKKMEELSGHGIRFIGIATTDNKYSKDMKLSNLTLVGLVGLRDDIRPLVKESIDKTIKAGIQVVMVTGDSKATATAIAKELELIDYDSIITTSDELALMTDETLKKKLPKIRVIARALPTDKSRLVKIAQELNLVVGMTGDGVNDAPAIKKADVGFAMGSGTEVAKEASDIVILDNNFLSITKAILYGRTIFKNIRKFLILQLTINICAVGISIVGPFIGIENPITVIQMLWINMIMDTLAALAFAGEPALDEFMEEKPKRRDENIINRYMKGQILSTGIYSFILCLVFLKLPLLNNLFNDKLEFMTAFFVLFIFVGIFNCFNSRTERLNLIANLIKNKTFIIIMLFITAIQLYIIYYGGSIFRVTDLSSLQLVIVIIMAFSVIPFDWMRKLWLRKNNQKGGF